MERINLQQLTSGDWMQRFPHWQKPLSLWVTLICIALSAWIVGKMIWMLHSEQATVAAWSANASAQPKTNSGMDISVLQKGDLFGHYNDQTPPPAPVKVDAPKTRLNLVLVGVVASSEPSQSLAVIANRGSQATYGLNEVIEGTRVKLKAVMPDRVIIDNSGRDETLMLEGIDYSKVSAQPAAAPTRTAKDTPVEDKLDAIRAAVAKNPREIFQYVTLSQLKQDDKILGYRVSPGKDPALFESVGLQNGDIATQLNGLDLTDPDVMSKVFESITDLTEINLTVERDGQQHDIYIQF
ncbi:type II secretion system protein GspC [Vibrio fluvialis]|nr:type II secretion system protein GspC [Vibrio fluvialis]MBY8233409.1 type II secretion system protein GspC [Vibrio fluvialis]